MAHLVLRPSRRTLLIGAAAAATTAAGYVAYKFWLKGYLEERWGYVQGSASSAWKVLEAVAAASDLSSTVVSDLKTFLESDGDEIPRSMRQMLKLSRSPEFQQAVLCSTQSVTEGIALGVMRTTDPQGEASAEMSSGHSKGLVEVILEKLFTEEGKGFASAVCSRMVRTLVASLQSRNLGDSPTMSGMAGSSGSVQSQGEGAPWMVRLLDVLSTEQGKQLLTSVIQAFAVSGVGTYLDKTADVNMYHDMLAACERNSAAVKELGSHFIATSVREAVHSWPLRPGRRVQTDAACDGSSSSCSSSPRMGLIPSTAFSESDRETHARRRDPTSHSFPAEVGQFLAQPEIRSMILDVTGVMTTKGMEAFLLVGLYELFGKRQRTLRQGEGTSETAGTCVSPPSISSSTRGLQAKLMGSRALALASLCLAFLLHRMTL